MELVDTIIKQDNEMRKEEERIYRTKDNLGLKNYLEIKNKFFNKRLDDIIIDEINELGCRSYITLHYKIVFYEKKVDLFTNVVKINDREEADYTLYNQINEYEEHEETITNGFIGLYGDKFLLELVMNIMYYKFLPLGDFHIERVEDEEDEDEDNPIPPILETAFSSNHCKMWRYNKVQVENNNISYTIKYDFMYGKELNKLKDYKDYINEFKNFTLEKRYEDELINEGYQSFSNIAFFLHHKDDFNVLFSINLEIVNNIPEYIYHFDVYEENNVTKENFNNFIDKYKDSQEKIYLAIHMTTKFYTTLYYYSGNENEDEEDEDEDEDEEKIPPIIETTFGSDHCVICCTEKPNILNFPCLHISQCEGCEEMGRFINCSICRKEIQRKVKI